MEKADNSSPVQTATLTKRTHLRRRAGLTLCFLLLIAGILSVYPGHIGLREPDQQETILIGEPRVAAGQPAGWRVLVRNRTSLKPVRGAAVTMSLKAEKGDGSAVETFKTGEDGAVQDGMVIPRVATGKYRLALRAESPLGQDEITRTIEIVSEARLALMTDKPLYQPGQTIHMRALARGERSHEPLAGSKVIFEVSDPRGNMLFKEAKTTSKFGIASADFELASELNLGIYSVRVMWEGGETERKVEVRRYVMPRFRVNVTPEKKFWLSGQTITGVVRAEYYFGKPLADSEVKLTLRTEEGDEVGSASGRTGTMGQYPFAVGIPDGLLKGTNASGARRTFELVAEVRDGAGHLETGAATVTATLRDFIVRIAPEGGSLVRGLENNVYVIATHADGSPASCRIRVNGKESATDSKGVGQIRVTPDRYTSAVEVLADDGKGGQAYEKCYVTDPDLPQIILRTDKAVYRAGEEMQVELLTRERSSHLFLDLLKDGHSVWKGSAAIRNGKGELRVLLPEGIDGTLEVRASAYESGGEERSVSRLIGVASDLKIQAQIDKETYRPGETGESAV